MCSPLQLGTAYFLSETGELLMMVSAVKYLERPCSAHEEIKLETLGLEMAAVRTTSRSLYHKAIAWRCRWLEVPLIFRPVGVQVPSVQVESPQVKMYQNVLNPPESS